MRAAIMRDKQLFVDDAPDPRPQAGQLLTKVLACGICGSDLHALEHGDLMVEMSTFQADESVPEAMRPRLMDLDRDVVMGHEFAAEVIELGEGCTNHQLGDVVVSMPLVFDPHGIHPVGYSNEYPGGYAEQIVLSDMVALTVPNGLDPERAALTEPMAVGVHAVNKSGINPREAAVVLGCGPVGLAVIAALSRLGVETIVAADFSSKRRALATTMGATEVVDPREEPALDAWRRVDGFKGLVIYEAVGVPGMIDAAITSAPRDARILVVGVCMQPDTIRPMLAIGRELTIQFALGYQPDEFADTLRAIAEGEFDVAPLVTGSVGIDGVPQAFTDLADPDAHAKILVTPSS